MRIKRFTAPDMRTALRLIREDQGPDAVILSNRPIEGGIEVVAATDYDEALVSQALRAAAPATAPAIASAPPPAVVSAPVATPVAAAFPARPAMQPAPAAPQAPVPPPTFASLLAQQARTPGEEPTQLAQPTLARPDPAVLATRPADVESDSFLTRARSVFKPAHAAAGAHALASGTPRANGELTLAELSALAAATTPPRAAVPNRLDAMMAALNPEAIATPQAPETRPTATAAETPPLQAEWMERLASVLDSASALDEEPVVQISASVRPVDPVPAAPLHVEPAPLPAPAPAVAPAMAEAAQPRVLQAVPAVAAAAADSVVDPAVLAMRADLATMRQMMEQQMDALSFERLRGSPARAAAYDALVQYGCDNVLAQAVAAKLDARLDPAEIHAPMFAALAGMLRVARSEPLDDGGVIALVGPTGAGKTTTAAKLAARFAARHRARDVALVTTDAERAGASEQLHAHGRRLGITVCEATGPDGLSAALKQLAGYPLVLVDTTGYAPRDRALFSQILWLRAAQQVRCLLVLPANGNPHDLGQVVRRYLPAAPEGAVITKLDETDRPGSVLSVAVRHGLTLTYTTHGQEVPADIDVADANRLAGTQDQLRSAADHTLPNEDHHAFA